MQEAQGGVLGFVLHGEGVLWNLSVFLHAEGCYDRLLYCMVTVYCELGVREMLSLLYSAPHVRYSIGGGVSEVMCRRWSVGSSLSEAQCRRCYMGSAFWEVQCGRCSVKDTLLRTRDKMFRCSGCGHTGCSAYVCPGSPAARMGNCAEGAQFSKCGITLLDAHELARVGVAKRRRLGISAAVCTVMDRLRDRDVGDGVGVLRCRKPNW